MKTKTIVILGGLVILALTVTGIAAASGGNLDLRDVVSGTATLNDLTTAYQIRDRDAGGEGDLHDYLIAAIAEALGMDPAELEARLESGERLYTIAEEQGYSFEEFQTLMWDAREAALAAAVEDGVLPEEAAERMLAAGAMAGGFGYAHRKGPWGHGPDLWGVGPFTDEPGTLLAGFLGLSVEEIQARIESGETVEEIVTGAGETMEAFAEYAADAHIAAVQAAVAAGDLTAEQGEAMIAKIQEKLANGWTWPTGPCGPTGQGTFGPGHSGRGGPHGPSHGGPPTDG